MRDPFDKRLKSQDGLRFNVSSGLAALLLVGSVLLPFSGMHLLGVQVFHWFDLSIVPWDFGILLGATIVALLVALRFVRLPDKLSPLFYAIVALVVWFAFQAARSPAPLRGWTMEMMLLRDVLMFAALHLALQNRVTSAKINSAIAIIGIAFVAASFLPFLFSLNDHYARLPHGGSFVLFEGQIPRFIGFARDPGFFALIVSISLFAIPFARGVPQPVKWIGAAMFFTAIFFSGSRMLPASVLVAVAVYLVVPLIRSNRSHLKILAQTLVPGLLIAALFLPLWFQIPREDGSLGSRLTERYRIGVETPRTRLWEETVEGLYNGSSSEGRNHDLSSHVISVLFGKGLRSNQHLLDGQYSHNTYLDLLGETGLVGLLLWLTLTAMITVRAFRATSNDFTMVPWLLSWITLLGFLTAFSLLVAPYYWFVAGIISGLSYRREGSPSRLSIPVHLATHRARATVGP